MRIWQIQALRCIQHFLRPPYAPCLQAYIRRSPALQGESPYHGRRKNPEMNFISMHPERGIVVHASPKILRMWFFPFTSEGAPPRDLRLRMLPCCPRFLFLMVGQGSVPWTATGLIDWLACNLYLHIHTYTHTNIHIYIYME